MDDHVSGYVVVHVSGYIVVHVSAWLWNWSCEWFCGWTCEWLQKLVHAMTYFMDVCGPPVIGRGKLRLYTLHS